MLKTVDPRTCRFVNGQKFNAKIDGKSVEGRVRVLSNGKVYLCQNVIRSTGSKEKLGYNYSWRFDSNRISNLMLDSMDSAPLPKSASKDVYTPKPSSEVSERYNANIIFKNRLVRISNIE